LSKQTPIQINDETRREINELATLWGYPSVRNTTPVVVRAVTQARMIESARRTMTESQFVSFLAELYRPINHK